MGHRGPLDLTALDRAGTGQLWSSEVLTGIAAEKAPVPLTPITATDTFPSPSAKSLLPLISSRLSHASCSYPWQGSLLLNFPARSVFRSHRQLPRESRAPPAPSLTYQPTWQQEGRAVLCSHPACGHFPAGSVFLPNSEPSLIPQSTPFPTTLPETAGGLGGKSHPSSSPTPLRPLPKSSPSPQAPSSPPLIGLIYSAEQHFVIADNATFPAPPPFTTAWHEASGS